MRDNLVLATGKAPITLSALREARAAPGPERKPALSQHIACGEGVQCVRHGLAGRK